MQRERDSASLGPIGTSSVSSQGSRVARLGQYDSNLETELCWVILDMGH